MKFINLVDLRPIIVGPLSYTCASNPKLPCRVKGLSIQIFNPNEDVKKCLQKVAFLSWAKTERVYYVHC